MVMSARQDFGRITPFNSSLEVGIRVAIILNSFHPRRLSLLEIALYDYFVIHTSDANGPPSIHPSIPSRHGEYFVRRGRIEAGLALMRNAHMVHYHSEPNGVAYEASEKAGALIDTLMSPYNRRLKECADWLAQETFRSDLFQVRLTELIGGWSVQLGKDLN